MQPVIPIPPAATVNPASPVDRTSGAAQARPSHPARIAARVGARLTARMGVVTRLTWWPAAKRACTLALLLAVVGMLAWNARHVDWHAVWAALQDYPARVLAIAGALTACSFAVYSCFDLLARRYTRAAMSVPAVMTVTFVSHALGLNLGVAGVALRFRLYGAYGIEAGVVARIWGLSVVTNWLGFVVLGGVIFTGRLIDLPASELLGAPMGAATMSAVGLALLAGTGLYLAVCAFASGRRHVLFGREVSVPSFAFGAWQFVLSAANWTLIAGVLWVLLRGQIDFPTVLGVYLLSAIALSVVDVPGGLGITEAVFLALLGTRMPIPDLLAALVVYRAVFYLAPMAPALLAYAAIEARQRNNGVSAGKDTPTRAG